MSPSGGRILLIAVGAAMAVFVMLDAVRTTINLSDVQGPLARAVVSGGRRVVRLLPIRMRRGAGLFITVAVVLSWTTGLWVAWTVALLDPSVELVRAADGTPLGVTETIYLAGFSVFTLGTGDVESVTNAGRLVSVGAAATGLFTVTLEVTYLISLTQAAAHERSTARQAYALGGDVTTILRRSYRDGRFTDIEPLLTRLARDLNQVAEQHRSFPVLHDVLPRERSLALGPTLLGLSDAIDVMRFAAPSEARIGALAYEQMAEAMEGLISRLPIDQRIEAPPAAPAARLLEPLGCAPARDVPAGPAIDRRRRCLFALAEEEGWRDVAEEAIRPAEDG